MNSMTEHFSNMNIDDVNHINTVMDDFNQQFESLHIHEDNNMTNPIRNKVRNYFSTTLSTDEKYKDIVYEIAIAIETAMFLKFSNTGKQYKAFFRNLIFNLRDMSNPELNEKIISNMINPLNLVNMTYIDFASDKMKADRIARSKWSILEARSDLIDNTAMSDLFKCGKCKQSKTTFYQLQTRGSDEPLTTFVFCVICSNRWRC